MQTPSQVVPLDLTPGGEEAHTDGLGKGQSFQKIVRFDLKEEGNHILAVSVSYTETVMAENLHAASGRVRTFRKLYQFIAQPCLSVRTKASELPPLEVDNKSLGPYGKTRLLRFALEAQLENVGDGAVLVEVGFPRRSTGRCVYRNLSLTSCSANHIKPQTPIQVPFVELGLSASRLSETSTANLESAGCSPGCVSC